MYVYTTAHIFPTLTNSSSNGAEDPIGLLHSRSDSQPEEMSKTLDGQAVDVEVTDGI